MRPVASHRGALDARELVRVEMPSGSGEVPPMGTGSIRSTERSTQRRVP